MFYTYSPFGVFFLAQDVTHLVVDLVFVVTAVIQLRYVIATGRRQHLRWVVPYLIGDVFTLFYRLIVEMRHLHTLRLAPQEYIIINTVLLFGDLWGVWGVLAFTRMLVTGQVFGAANPSTALPSDPDVWPPPPSRTG
jgi:hypothetical protein